MACVVSELRGGTARVKAGPSDLSRSPSRWSLRPRARCLALSFTCPFLPLDGFFFFLFFWHVPVVASSFKWPILAPRRFSFAPPRRLASSFQCPFLLLVGRFWPRPSRCFVTSTPLLAPRRPSLPRPSSCPVLSTPLHAPRCPSPPRPSRCIVPSTPSLAPLTPLCAGPSPFAPREGLTSVV